MNSATLFNIMYLIMVEKMFCTEVSSIKEQIKRCHEELKQTFFEKEMLVDKRRVLKEKLDKEMNIFDTQYADKPSNPNDHEQQQNLKNMRKLNDKIEFIDYRIKILDKELVKLEKEKKELKVKENLSSFNI